MIKIKTFVLTIAWVLLLSPCISIKAESSKDFLVKKEVQKKWDRVEFEIKNSSIYLSLTIFSPEKETPGALLHIFNCKAVNCTRLINKAIRLLLKEAKPFIVKSPKLEVYLTPRQIPDIFSHYIEELYKKEKQQNLQGCKFTQGKYEYSDHANAWRFIEDNKILLPLFKGVKGFKFDKPDIPVDRYETNAFAKTFCVDAYKKFNPYYKIPSFVPSWYLVNNAGSMDITFNK